MTLQTERELFEACMDLAAGQRTAWLEQHCGDAPLRERVLRLLRAHDSAQEPGSLEQSPLVTARRIGDFDLLERIGEGAMVCHGDSPGPSAARPSRPVLPQRACGRGGRG